MRKFGPGWMVVAFAALAFPPGSSATHGTTCNYAKTQAVPVKVVDDGTNQVYVYEGSGTSGQADEAVGVCVYSPNASGFNGGTVEAGASATNGVVPLVGGSAAAGYGVFDGDNSNTPPDSNAYWGVSNFETGGFGDPQCTRGDGNGAPGSTNSGGCVGVGPVSFPAPLLMCGGVNDRTWDSTSRDGCYVP